MNDDPLNPSVGLQPKSRIIFPPNSRASLVRPINQPIFDDDPDGLIIFGDSSAIYMAKVGQGAAPYKTPLKTTTIIHGWALDAGNLFVMEGVELSKWNLSDFTKTHSVQLLTEPDATTAKTALTNLKLAIQMAEWATLLEQAEDEYVRLTPPQPDFLKMLTDLRTMVGCTDSTTARQKIADLRMKLAEKRKAAGPYLFSPPVVRLHSLQEPLVSVFVIQGNAMIHAYDKQLGGAKKLNWGKTQAEPYLALLDDRTTAPKRLAFVAESTLYAIDAHSLEPTGFWSPTTVPAAGTTHSLTVGNRQFWWSTDSGVYACKPDETTLQLTWETGPAWNPRQVGRVGVPTTIYNPSPDPNDLFESMNVRGWIDQRQDKTAPLNDGMAAQLMLSDENGKYVTPPTGTSHVIYGPFGRDGVATHSWGAAKPHPSFPLVLLSDSNTASILSRYPSPCSLNQLLPQWVVAPWLSAVTHGSPTELALSQSWPAPAVRPLSKPQPNMIAYWHNSAARNAIRDFEERVTIYTNPSRMMADRELRYIFWWAIFNHEFPNIELLIQVANAKKVLNVFYTDAQVQDLCKRFTGLGTVWDYWPGNAAHAYNFDVGKPSVDFDPPWLWKTQPGSPLFHKTPPKWYDPWGYNRPGDFVSQQPTPTYLDPFCFNGQLRFPQRSVPFNYAFKGHQWAVFTDNDPPVATSNVFRAPEVSAEPGILVIRADEDRKLTSFYLLPAKHLGVTFDAPSHDLHPEALPTFGTAAEQILGIPGVFLDTAWCVGSLEYPSARLHKIITVDPTKSIESPWETFVNENKTKYGPSGGSTTWKIDECPLPTDVLPSIILFGYGLPEPH